jgi:hypothetical protein
LPVLDPGRGRTKTGRLWCYAVDNRPWSGPGHPAAVYAYSEDRKGEHRVSAVLGMKVKDYYTQGRRGVRDLPEILRPAGVARLYCANA